MKKNELLPYFHPTQLVLVDDDIDFLGNLSLQLEADLAYLLFDSTAKALDYIDECEMHTPPRQRFFNMLESANETGGSAAGRTRVSLNTKALANEMYFTNRFSRISVAMVDYAMPQVNGIEFCKRIRNPHIKKILFTGVATEAEAVEAFNQGVIDRFVRKSEYQVYDNLNRAIRELQEAHIRDMFSAAAEVFDIDKPRLLSDPAVVELMGDLKARYQYAEYYLASRPWGFILIDADGKAYRLVLLDEQDQRAQFEQARAASAPAECLKALEAGRIIMNPAAFDEGGDVDRVFREWQQHCLPATTLDGQIDYRWAVFPQSSSQPPIAAYNNFLEWLDTVGYSLM